MTTYGTCSRCGYRYALKRDGSIRKHMDPGAADMVCQGTGGPPSKAEPINTRMQMNVSGDCRQRTTKDERQQFVIKLREEFVGCEPDVLRAVTALGCELLSAAASHGIFAERACNGPSDRRRNDPESLERFVRWTTESYRKAEDRASEACAQLATLHKSNRLPLIGERFKVVFSGDPRGYTIKVVLPSGDFNTWGGPDCGWGVPGS